MLVTGWTQTNAPAEQTATNAPVSTEVTSVTNSPAPATGTNFQSFRVIAERNIFNQSRGPRSARRGTAATRPAPKIQSLSLVGTMSYSKGTLAFFDGTNPAFKKPVKSGEKIAGYEVKEIATSSVKISNDTQEFNLKVGQQLRQVDDGEWQLNSGPAIPASSSASASPGAAAAPEPSGSISEDEAVKRLMEKRAKELNQ
jgi:hypothetical protein